MEKDKKEDKKVTIFLPCRAGSQRIIRKNMKPFAGSSLLAIKLDQLLKIKRLDKIIVSTDDPEVISYCESLNNSLIEIEHREKYYAGPCTTDELCDYVARKIDAKGLFLWTHVTSPFMDEKIYDKAIEEYIEKSDEHDSMATVNRIQSFVWDKNYKKVNYGSYEGNWPKTQDLDPLFEINSGMFLIPFELMKKASDRIGKTPLFFETNQLHSLDIDWPDDFEVAEKIWLALK